MERSLHHPALLSLYSSFIFRGSRYSVMEFCDRGSLCQFIESHVATNSSSMASELTFKPILRRVAEALSFLHSQGAIHGDVRPHNVFLTADGRAASLSCFSMKNCHFTHISVEIDGFRNFSQRHLWGKLSWRNVQSRPLYPAVCYQFISFIHDTQ